MGISGLIVFVKSGGLESAIRNGHISEFRGKRAGVDVYSWIHKSIFTCAFDLFIGKPTSKYVEFCMRQIKLLTDCGVIPVLVFDGCNMPFKVVDKKRREDRECAKRQAKDLIAAGKQSEAFKYIVKSVDITHEMAYEVIKAARAINIDCIVAPYEADAQLAYLQKEKYIDIIITEDSDLIVFGCETIFFKMKPTGDGEIYEKSKLPAATTRPNIRFRNFDFNKFRYAAILSGCDYLQNLPGIGLAKAWKFMNVTEIEEIRLFLKKIPSYLKLKIVVEEQYINDFIMADMSFRYQYVFDPVKLKRVTFDSADESTEDFKKFANSFAPIEADHVQLALGNIDRNNRVYGHFNLDNVPMNSIFRSTFSETKCTKHISFPEIKTVNKKRQITEPLQEITNEVEDNELINLYKNINNSDKEREDSLSPPFYVSHRKRPKKCKFVKSFSDPNALTTSKYFGNNEENKAEVELINVTIVSEMTELRTGPINNCRNEENEADVELINTATVTEIAELPTEPINNCRIENENDVGVINTTIVNEITELHTNFGNNSMNGENEVEVSNTIVKKNTEFHIKPVNKTKKNQLPSNQTSILSFFKKQKK